MNQISKKLNNIDKTVSWFPRYNKSSIINVSYDSIGTVGTITAKEVGADSVVVRSNANNTCLDFFSVNVVPGITGTEINWLAALIFYEARGFTSNYAKELVAQVILSRVNDSRFPNTIEGVLKAPGQYGWPTTGLTATNIFENKWVNHPEYAACQAACYTAARKVANKTSVDEYGNKWPANVLYQHSFSNPSQLGTLFKTYTQVLGSTTYYLHFNLG